MLLRGEAGSQSQRDGGYEAHRAWPFPAAYDGPTRDRRVEFRVSRGGFDALDQSDVHPDVRMRFGVEMKEQFHRVLPPCLDFVGND